MNRLLILFSLVPLSLIAQDVTIHALDRSGSPIEDVDIRVYYERIGKLDSSQVSTGKTDENGMFKGSGSAELSIFLSAEKEGYYPYGKYPTPKDEMGAREDIEKVIQLSKRIDPIPLYGTFKAGGVIPIESEWCGYDMEQRDWVKPHGKGNSSDILFRVEKEFMGFDTRYWQRTLDERREFSKKAHAARSEEWTEEKFKLRNGKWDTRFEIAFPNEKEGLVKVVDGFKPHSLLHMPHQAPVDGYEASHAYELKNYERNELSDDLGFFIRTRVVLDEDGNIESANYEKVHGEFRVRVNGTIGFTYYFNPVPNDRNLEFDPKQNLFPEGTPGTFNFVLP